MFNNPYLNPYFAQQQRLQQYEQQYPQYLQNQGQNQFQNQQAQQGLNTLQVSNIEEANAYRVDPLGTPTFFYNPGKNEIYLKKTNQIGLTDFLIFRHVEKPADMVKDEKQQNIYAKEFKAINDKIDGLYSILVPQPKTKEAKNDK